MVFFGSLISLAIKNSITSSPWRCLGTYFLGTGSPATHCHNSVEDINNVSLKCVILNKHTLDVMTVVKFVLSRLDWLFIFQVYYLSSATGSEHLSRHKRTWIIDSFSMEEEQPGPFPYVLGKVRTTSEKTIVNKEIDLMACTVFKFKLKYLNASIGTSFDYNKYQAFFLYILKSFHF